MKDILPVYLGKLSDMGMEAAIRMPKKEPEDLEALLKLHVRKGTTPKVFAWVLLGGRQFMSKEPVSGMDFWKAGQQGIRRDAVNRLATVLDLSMSDMADLLHVSYKTLSRKPKDALLDSLLSSICIEIAETTANGLLLFEQKDRFNRWLRKENRALHNQRPIDLLQNLTGIRMVNTVLHRIEEGIYT